MQSAFRECSEPWKCRARALLIGRHQPRFEAEPKGKCIAAHVFCSIRSMIGGESTTVLPKTNGSKAKCHSFTNGWSVGHIAN